MFQFRARVFLVLVFFFTSSFLIAAVPKSFHLQGRLTDVNGNPITVPTLVEFGLYQGGGALQANEGQVVYKERVTITPSRDGVYEHVVGNGVAFEGHTLVPSDFQTNEVVYLQLTIAGSALLPRILMGSQPYALVSHIAESVTPQSIKPESLSPSAFAAPGLGVVPAGGILMFLANVCPSGFIEVEAFRNRSPIGSDLSGSSAYIPNTSNVAVGSATHDHSIRHSHISEIEESFDGKESIVTGEAFVAFSHPKLVGGTGAYGSGDVVALDGWSHKHSITQQTTQNSGATEWVPPSLTVLFCMKE